MRGSHRARSAIAARIWSRTTLSKRYARPSSTRRCTQVSSTYRKVGARTYPGVHEETASHLGHRVAGRGVWIGSRRSITNRSRNRPNRIAIGTYHVASPCTVGERRRRSTAYDSGRPRARSRTGARARRCHAESSASAERCSGCEHARTEGLDQWGECGGRRVPHGRGWARGTVRGRGHRQAVRGPQGPARSLRVWASSYAGSLEGRGRQDDGGEGRVRCRSGQRVHRAHADGGFLASGGSLRGFGGPGEVDLALALGRTDCYLPHMSNAARRLIDEAMGLTDDERLEVAAELLASVDGPPDDDWQGAWLREIERRRSNSEAAGRPASAWQEARDRILRRLGRE